MPASQALLILGPHRSGTSAFARVLSLLGVDLGREMLPAKPDNRFGFWEHGEVFEIHEQLLDHLGSAWHDYRPLSPGWSRQGDVHRFRARLRSFLDREFGGKPLWGVKDPRACRLLPLWLQALDELGVDAGFLIVVRNPLEVVQSLGKRNQFSPSKSLLLYLDDMLAAIHHTQGLPRTFVSYEDLLRDWYPVVAEIGRKLQVVWPNEPATRRGEIESFLRPSERHHHHTVEDLGNESLVPEWCQKLHTALEETCRGCSTEFEAAFAEAYDSFLSACALFVPEIDRLENRITRLSAAHTSAEKQMTDLRHRIEASTGTTGEELAGLEAVSSEVTPSIDAEETDRAGRPTHLPRQRVAELQDALARAHRERDVFEQRHEQLRRRARRAEDELEKVQKHLTAILSGRLYRYTRGLRRGWYRLSRLL